jgi:hypothetical protein
MMNQPLRRVDPLGRSAPSAPHHSIDAYLDPLAPGSAWPISGGSREAIVDTGSELGEFLRRRGLHEDQLRQWQETADAGALESLRGRKPAGKSAETKRVKELERELRRKEKALAEAAALLVLRKKAEALWGDEDASTESKTDDESSN